MHKLSFFTVTDSVFPVHSQLACNCRSRQLEC